MSNLWAALQSLEMLSFPGKAVESQPLLGTTGGGGTGSHQGSLGREGKGHLVQTPSPAV